jgi:hypothetical protein
MRRALAVETCVALFVAFQAAPYQHVHSGSNSVVHAHFYSAHIAHELPGIHVEADDDDDHRPAWSLDTFAPMAPVLPVLCPPSRAPLSVFVPAVSSMLAQTVEQRGHDPPRADSPGPRAPPL